MYKLLETIDVDDVINFDKLQPYKKTFFEKFWF